MTSPGPAVPTVNEQISDIYKDYHQSLENAASEKFPEMFSEIQAKNEEIDKLLVSLTPQQKERLRLNLEKIQDEDLKYIIKHRIK